MHLPADVDSVPAWRQDPDDIVISGISCRFPESDNMEEFKENLFNSMDLVTEDNRRWEPGVFNLPKRNGKLKDLTKFDAEFFGMTADQTNNMDPQLRLSLEVHYEALCDAGILPETWRGTDTGIYSGGLLTETSEVLSHDSEASSGEALLGTMKFIFANRISYQFDFRGPSVSVDTACSSSLLAMQLAVAAMRTGQCHQAIASGSHVIMIPTTDVQFLRLGMLSPRGMCQSFDDEGDGYVRSEGVCAVILQRRSEAKRAYATVIHAKCNTDGFKEHGVTFPSSELQAQLCRETYQEAGLDPLSVVYIEAHGTGTRAGDPQEVNAIARTFCGPDRKGPLLIGSVKSNMGHSEPTSGLAAVAKMIIAMEAGKIPANLHFRKPNSNIPSLHDGTLKVVAEHTDWNGGIVGINSFGFGGSNVHAILKFEPNQTNPAVQLPQIPKVFCCTGRTKEATEMILKLVQQHPEDHSLYCLLSGLMNTSPTLHPYRGYMVFNPQEPEKAVLSVEAVPVKDSAAPSRPVWFIYSGMGAQWIGMARDMLKIQWFRDSFVQCSEILEQFGFNLLNLVLSNADKLSTDSVLSVVVITAIQVAITDTLRHLGIQPNGMIGHSIGEVACSYADGCLTLKQTMLCAYWRAKCVVDADVPTGAMAAVGLTWEETSRRCPADVFPACHNSEETVTVSGKADAVKEFVQRLQNEDVFAREINTTVPFHSAFIRNAEALLKRQLTEVIPEPKPRSEKWLSSSFPPDQWDLTTASTCSAEYNVNNLISPVYFYQCVQRIPANAIVIEIAPDAYLQAVIKRTLPINCASLGLQSRKSTDNLSTFLASLGKLYQECCVGIHVDRLYPRVQYPVPARTPWVGSRIRWNHSREWRVISGMEAIAFRSSATSTKVSRSFVLAPLSAESEEQYLAEHVVNGKIIYPVGGYIHAIWSTLAQISGSTMDKLGITLDHTVFHSDLELGSQPVKLDVCILPTDHFTVTCQGILLVSGRVKQLDENSSVLLKQLTTPSSDIPKTPSALTPKSTTMDYDQLSTQGLKLGQPFRVILKSCDQDNQSQLVWQGNWVTFLTGVLQNFTFATPSPWVLERVSRIEHLRIDPKEQPQVVDGSSEAALSLTAVFDPTIKGVVVGGVEMSGVVTQKKPLPLVSLVENKAQLLNQEPGRRCCMDVIASNGAEATSLERYLQITTPGDLSSLKWLPQIIEKRLFTTGSNMEPVKVNYTVVSTRDLLVASGDLNCDLVSQASASPFGQAFSGYRVSDSSNPVMGVVSSGAMANQITVQQRHLWDVPQKWDLTDAASVPLAYLTAYYSLFVRTHLSHTDSVLVHMGCSSVGLAAIGLATSKGAEVHVTVTCEEQRRFLLDRFPNLNENRIYSVQSTEFVAAVLRETDGRGVKVVLSSLTREQMYCSIKCLAKSGRFLQLGYNVDLLHNNSITMGMFMKNIQLHGILIDNLFQPNAEPAELEELEQTISLFNEGLKTGEVRPLPTEVYIRSEVQQAFEKAARTETIGNVLVTA